MSRRKDRSLHEYADQRDSEPVLSWYAWIWAAIRPLVILLCSLTLLAGIVTAAWRGFSAAMVDPVDPSDSADISFTVESGESLSRVSDNLEQQGLIRNASVFKYYADFLGYGQKIQAGQYTLRRSMQLSQIAARLTAGDGRPIVRDITIIPGWTVEDVVAYLVQESVLADASAFLARCREGTEYAAYYYISDVLSSKTAAERKYALEGYLAPDTYEIFVNAAEDDIIRKLLSQTEAVFKESYHTRAEEQGFSMDQMLTIASLIEKEAKTADFKKVSAVFHNRFASGMRLDSDVTIKYVLGTKRMVLTAEDLAVDSPYNTYRHKGLPPGPICGPSPQAVEAALYPDEDFVVGGYLYFCSKDPDSGELHFSKTLKEHEQAVRVYAPLWEAFDRESGAQ